MSRWHSLFALTVLALAGCATTPREVPAPRPASTPLAVAVQTPRNFAADDLNATVWSQLAVEHDLIYREVYRQARDTLLKALADPTWDALPHGLRSGGVAGLAPAVVLDIDETVLDNSPYQARLIRTGAAYSDASWAKWVREEAAAALPGALEYTRFAAAHGIKVIYISNRDQSLDQATLANLRKLGFPVSGADAFLGLGTQVAGCVQHATDKGCRRRLVARKYRVLAQIGDQIGDFVNISTNTPTARRAQMAPYRDWIGSRWFMLPNPTYGSWEPAAFGNNWKLPAAERHQRKIDALRVQ